MFQKRVKSKSKRCCPGDVVHACSHTSCNQARSASGGGTESNLVQIILVCFISKNHNPIQKVVMFLIVRLHRGLSNSKEIVLAYTECRVMEKVKLQPQEQAKSQDQ